MGDLSIHFSLSEFACRDCGRVIVHPYLIGGLEDIRRRADAPLVIHDGFRCPIHNLNVGGVGGSQHPEGKAADWSIPGKTLAEMYSLALSVPAFRNGGIGIYEGGFIHTDIRDHLARWARVGGKYTSIELSGLRV